MDTIKLTLFYRDGDNYKCVFDVDVEKDLFNAVVEQEGGDIDEILDVGFSSEITVEIERLGLEQYDIPMIQEYGISDMDHNYVSIVKLGE